jgi:signal transduction histidine kinase
LGNAGALNQVFLNLLKNAAEALEASGGSVSVVAAREGEGTLVVKVEDDGPGMTPEVRGRLFEPFFSTKGAGRGTGLGLSISRRIVKDLGGSIDVESTLGSGTRFFVRLPVEGAQGEERRRER